MDSNFNNYVTMKKIPTQVFCYSFLFTVCYQYHGIPNIVKQLNGVFCLFPLQRERFNQSNAEYLYRIEQCAGFISHPLRSLHKQLNKYLMSMCYKRYNSNNNNHQVIKKAYIIHTVCDVYMTNINNNNRSDEK